MRSVTKIWVDGHVEKDQVFTDYVTMVGWEKMVVETEIIRDQKVENLLRFISIDEVQEKEKDLTRCWLIETIFVISG